MTLQQLEYFLAAARPWLLLGGRREPCTWPSRACRSRSAGSRPSSASPLFVARPPRPRADRGGAAAAAARRAHAGRRAGGAATPSREVRDAGGGHGDASAPSATRPTTCSPTSCRTSAALPQRARAPDRPELLRGRRRRPRRPARGRADRAADRRPRARHRPAIATSCSTSRADPERAREPMTIERLAEAPLILYDARFGWATRRAASSPSARSARA